MLIIYILLGLMKIRAYGSKALDIISFANVVLLFRKVYYTLYTRYVYEMFESECFILFKLGLFFIVEIFGCFILTQIYCVITKTYIAIS